MYQSLHYIKAGCPQTCWVIRSNSQSSLAADLACLCPVPSASPLQASRSLCAKCAEYWVSLAHVRYGTLEDALIQHLKQLSRSAVSTELSQNLSKESSSMMHSKHPAHSLSQLLTAKAAASHPSYFPHPASSEILLTLARFASCCPLSLYLPRSSRLLSSTSNRMPFSMQINPA